MAFRKKFERIFALKPDLLFIQECEHPDRLNETIDPSLYNEIHWYGDNPHKGLAVLNFTEFKLHFLKTHNPEFRYILPYQLEINKSAIQLFHIWAMPHENDRAKSYVGQIWQAIQYYSYSEEATILIGDFNSHVQWDKERKHGNHSDLVNYLADKSIVSAYHLQRNMQAGDEKEDTYFMYKKRDKGYHMDYCFLSTSLLQANFNCRIGKYENWIELSDHLPIILDL